MSDETIINTEIFILELKTEPVRLLETVVRLPFPSYVGGYELDVPCETYYGDFSIQVCLKNKEDGLKMLFAFAREKVQERIDKLLRTLEGFDRLRKEIGENRND